MHKPMLKILSLAGNEAREEQNLPLSIKGMLVLKLEMASFSPRISNPVWKFHGSLDFNNLISRYVFFFGVQEAAGFNLILLK